MADNTTWLVLGAAAVGGYWWYKKSQAAPLPQVMPLPVTPASRPGPIPGSPALGLDQIYNAMVGLVTQDGGDPFAGTYKGRPMSAADWQVYLQLASKLAPPPLTAVFTQEVLAKYDGIAMPIGIYWGIVSGYLKTQYGLSGLGVFGGLGALAMAGRR